jgi:hypothetical protein
MLRASADLLPEYAEAIMTALQEKGAMRPPWELG